MPGQRLWRGVFRCRDFFESIEQIPQRVEMVRYQIRKRIRSVTDAVHSPAGAQNAY